MIYLAFFAAVALGMDLLLDALNDRKRFERDDWMPGYLFGASFAAASAIGAHAILVIVDLAGPTSGLHTHPELLSAIAGAGRIMLIALVASTIYRRHARFRKWIGN